jgi:hypothetical protein
MKPVPSYKSIDEKGAMISRQFKEHAVPSRDPELDAQRLNARRLVMLYVLFLLLSFGMGYPTLNRYDPARTKGLEDVKSYAAMVTGASVIPGQPHMRFRVLVPWMARPFYAVARGRVGSWDPVMFGMLSANSILVAGTALLIVVVGTGVLRSYPASLIASLVYLLNFAVPNLRLVGLVDAGEAFFLLALYCALAEELWWTLPLISILGASAKESFIPFSIVFTAAWWIVERKKSNSATRSAIWIAASWLLSVFTLIAVHRLVSGHFDSLIGFTETLQGNYAYFSQFLSSITDRNLWYVFIWLLPLGIPKLKHFPKSWLIPAAAAAVMAFVLDGYYSGANGTVGRALFTITGPLLCLSSAFLLLGDDPVAESS